MKAYVTEQMDQSKKDKLSQRLANNVTQDEITMYNKQAQNESLITGTTKSTLDKNTIKALTKIKDRPSKDDQS